MNLTNEQLIELRNKITEQFNLEEMRDICVKLGFDLEDLSGSSRPAKALELVQYCRRRSKLDALVAACASLRSEEQWPSGPVPRSADSSAASVGTAAEGKPITILFMASNPNGSDRLKLDVEVRTIDERLRKSDLGKRFSVEQQWATRVSDIQDAMLRFRPAIVHFSGHGSMTGDLVFEDAAGKVQEIRAEALGRLFRVFKNDVKCVVLNACWSAMQSKAIAAEIGCVVGMSRTVDDRAAANFAAGFYGALGYGKSVQDAFDLGCNQIDLSGLKDVDVPRLDLRADVRADQLKFI